MSTKKKALHPTTSNTTLNQSPSDTGKLSILQVLHESTPQALPEPVPQALSEPVPQTLPEPVSQALPESIPQALPEPILQALPQSNARSGEEDEKPKLGFSVALVIFAFAFLVCQHSIT